MADLPLQPSIATDLRSQALLALINRLKALDLSPILVYRIGSLVDSAVLAMAWQWDVLNPLLLPELTEIIDLTYAGWDQIQGLDILQNIDILLYGTEIESINLPLATVYAQYRALILLSTSLHSIMGTVGALKNALAGLGFPNAVLQEGQNSWEGTQYPSNQGWAVFRVLIDLLTVPINTDFTSLAAQMTAICNFWKPARCILDSVQFQWHLLDTLIPPVSDILQNIFTQTDLLSPQPRDFIVGLFAPNSETKTIIPFWNNRYYHAEITYGQNEPAVADSGVVVNGVPIHGN